jgi:hypothetical protein
MNDLGLTLAWLAVQVALVLAPALALYAMASRRGAVAGSWVASMSLGLVVMLNAAAFLPGFGFGRRPASDRASGAPHAAGTATPAGAPLVSSGDAPRRASGGGLPMPSWRVAWDRLGRGAAEPAARLRPWGGVLSALVLVGTGAGLLRLMIGLGAVVACRRRGRTVDDPAMLGLLDELRGAIGCRAAVELREVPDLVGPATAGWRRPVVLLPEDWRSWDESERRAVLAHELAHVVRGDYAAGLIARLAVALNVYHPMVHWMAGQLRLQQELAADAMGARHAGGRVGYLVALSRLALKQDGRSPCWPARAFLPARGTLIRRIAMLRDETRTGTIDRPWPRARRLATTMFLVGVTAAVATLRGPARGSEDGAPAAARPGAGSPAARPADASAPPLYVREDTSAVVMIRPALATRHMGVPLWEDMVGVDLSDLSKQLRVDTSRPGYLKLRAEDLEWVTATLRFGRGKTAQRSDLHSFMFLCPAFRTVAPFDWLAFLRQWRLEFAEVRETGRVYYRVTGPLKEYLGPTACVYLPDDRTIVFDEEEPIRKLAGQGAPPLPAFLRGPDWERASRGLLAVAIGNQDGAFAKSYDLKRPDDAVVLSLFKGVDLWTFAVEDADAIVLRATAACRSGDVSQVIARSIDSLVKLGRDAINHADPKAKEFADHERMFRMITSLMANMRVEHTDRSVGVHTDGFGTFADFAAVIEVETNEQKAQATKGAKQ